MGVHPKITIDTFPDQGTWLGKRTRVCFHYDSTRTIEGEIVRDDIYDSGYPGVTIIRLDDGRYVLTTECQHSPLD